MSKTNRLHAEVSTDDGVTWTSIWSLPGLQKAEKKVLKQTVSLAAYADRSILIRFAIRKNSGGTNLKWNAKSSGVWIDDIAVTNSAALLSLNESTVSLAASHVRLDAATAGQPLAHGATMRLRLRSMTGTTPGGWGPPLTVSPSSDTPEPALLAGFAGWAENEFPGLNLSFDGDHDRDGMADGIEYAFSLDPAVSDRVPDQLAVEPERIAISRDLPVQRDGIGYGAEWSEDLNEWSSDGIEIVIEAGRITASAPKGERTRFLRWQIEQR